jgi:hypothetical protein
MERGAVTHWNRSRRFGLLKTFGPRAERRGLYFLTEDVIDSRDPWPGSHVLFDPVVEPDGREHATNLQIVREPE